MNGADLWEDGYPHGTVEGYDGGCRGGACPAGVEHNMSCKRAKALSNGDFRYKRLATAGRTPAEIAAIIDGHEPAQPLAENSHDPAPQEGAGATTPRPREKHPTPEPVAEGEEMGHPTTTEDTTMPFEQFHPEKISTDQWTSGLTLRQKTEKLRQIREWCRNAGHDIPTKGKIPQAALADYAASHKTAAKELAETDVSTTDLPDAAAAAVDLAAAGKLNLVDAAGAAAAAVDTFDLHPTPAPANDDAGSGTEALAEFSEALEATRERLADRLVPTVGVRARPRFDDGVAVVREVWMDTGLVRVTYLPDVHDEETWSSLDWLDRVTALLPAEDFSFDEFGSDDMAGDLRAWRQAGRVWTEYGTPQHPLQPDLVAAPVPEPDPDRPEWGTVAESVAVERARDLAARMLDDNVELTRQRDSLEEHAADLRRERDDALAQLEFVLRQWATARERVAKLEAQLQRPQRPWWKRAGR